MEFLKWSKGGRIFLGSRMEDKLGDVSRRPSPLAGEGTDEGTVPSNVSPLTPTLSREGRGGPGLTPLMQQYHDLKSRYPTEVLLFRLGDFFELFGEDARQAAPILEVALTHRQQVPMCGVPAHSVEPYIAKLLKAGLRVAIADQLEEPSAAKGLVKRNVVRVMTAGTLQEDVLLPSKRCNFLVAMTWDAGGVGL